MNKRTSLTFVNSSASCELVACELFGLLHFDERFNQKTSIKT